MKQKIKFKADLHIHSNYSDGILSPSELVKKAKSKNIKCISITDHNSVAGVNEAIAAGKELDIEVIPGVEIMSEWGEVLGYFIDIKDKALLKLLKNNQKELDNSARQCIKGLQELGIKIDYVDVKKEFPKYPMMCFFVAQFLVKKGLIKKTSELYDKYVWEKIYLNYTFPKTEKIISIINKAKGVAVLAHPFAESDYNKEFENIDKLVQAGLCGIEIENGQYRSYDANIKKKIVELAKKYNLILTAGSDFHGGSVKSEIGNCFCSETIVKSLKNRAKNRI